MICPQDYGFGQFLSPSLVVRIDVLFHGESNPLGINKLLSINRSYANRGL